ncbi:DegV family protein [Tumebacillus permanentifrigoris]|uniref:DegV family protein with EDD domain n=1 Tax=Tumebacillus permanentifrigoris TaxID=378543 RepID=A0A316D6D1_9BACL|nr:DegV family protein [Tumebacillus permanentifrigoris]PWK06965.1 DegV family protein with EDD domain [Tumebacillus permanentifrigoris]
MIRIVTDSTCDLPQSLIEEHALTVIHLNVVIDGQTYADGIDLSHADFYTKMAQSKQLPTTSQPSPATFRDMFQEILDAGDDVYYVAIASTLSGTLQSARIARDLLDTPERVTIFDSLSTTYALGMLVIVASKLAAQGATADEITAELTSMRKRQRLVFSVDTLENLRKGGRINNLSFLFGSLLNIKPILQLDLEGVVQAYDRVRGKKNAILAVKRFLTEFPVDETYPVAIGHTVDPSTVPVWKQLLQELGITNILDFELSGVIGTHVGQGTNGIIYFSKA